MTVAIREKILIAYFYDKHPISGLKL